MDRKDLQTFINNKKDFEIKFYNKEIYNLLSFLENKGLLKVIEVTPTTIKGTRTNLEKLIFYRLTNEQSSAKKIAIKRRNIVSPINGDLILTTHKGLKSGEEAINKNIGGFIIGHYTLLEF